MQNQLKSEMQLHFSFKIRSCRASSSLVWLRSITHCIGKILSLSNPPPILIYTFESSQPMNYRSRAGTVRKIWPKVRWTGDALKQNVILKAPAAVWLVGTPLDAGKVLWSVVGCDSKVLGHSPPCVTVEVVGPPALATSRDEEPVVV